MNTHTENQSTHTRPRMRSLSKEQFATQIRLARRRAQLHAFRRATWISLRESLLSKDEAADVAGALTARINQIDRILRKLH